MNTLATSKLRQETDMVIGNMTMVCLDSHRIPNTVFWFHGSPLNSSVGLLLMQLSAISIVSQLFNLLLRPLGQSSIVSQIFVRFLFHEFPIIYVAGFSFTFRRFDMVDYFSCEQYNIAYH